MDNLNNLNVPITYQEPDIPLTVGATPTQIEETSFGLKEAGTAYTALAGGSSSVVAKELDAAITNYLPPALGGSKGRPYLAQEQVNQLWQDNGIADRPIDATKYNDVAVYELLDDAKRRKAASDIYNSTEFTAGGSSVRGASSLGLAALDPLNIATSLFPAGTVFKSIGLARVGASIGALEALGSTAATVGGRVGARLATGAIEATVGNVALEGITAPMRSDLGEDYHWQQSAANIGIGAILGAGIHTAVGGLRPGVGLPAKTANEELAMAVTPQTREDALTLATAQVEGEVDPTVNSLLKSDPNINQATKQDMLAEIKQMDNKDNSFMTRDVPDQPVIDKPIPYENEVDYETSVKELQAKQQEMQQLADQGLYSKVNKKQDIVDQQPTEFTDDMSSAAPAKLEQQRPGDQWFSDKILADEPGADSLALAHAIENEFGSDGASLLSTGRIRVVDSVDRLPGVHPKNTKGVTFKDGQVYLVAKNIDPTMVKGLVAHEVGVHVNMETFLGKEGFADLSKQVDNMISSDERIRSIIDEAIPKDTPASAMMQEKIAYLAETARELPLIQNMISKIKAWLFKTFPSLRNSLKLNDTDILNMAVASLRSYAKDSNAVRMGTETHYSEDVNPLESVEQNIADTDTAIKQVNELKGKMLQDAGTVVDIDDANVFAAYVKENIGNMDNDSAKTVFKDIQSAYGSAVEQGKPMPEQYAINHAMNKLSYGLEAHKTALYSDRYAKQKLLIHLNKSWGNRKVWGIRNILIGTTHSKQGARLNTLGDSMAVQKKLWQGNLDASLRKQGLDKIFYKNLMGEDCIRAHRAIEDGADVSQLPKEAVAIAKTVMGIYDGQLTSLNQHGLVTNKIQHYTFNQAAIHNQTKIIAAGFDTWGQIAEKTFDKNRVAEAVGVSPSDVNGEMLKGMFDGFATGEHIGNHGSTNGIPSGTPFSKVIQKQRKIFFKDADSQIEYMRHFGELDYQAAVINTIAGTSKKIGITQTMGVNYERNLKELVADFIKGAATPEEARDLKAFTGHTMQNMLESVDGRADIPISHAWARIGSNVRMYQSVSKLGSAMLSSINDLCTTASYLNRLGDGGVTYNMIKQVGKIFRGVDKDTKNMLGSLGIYSDDVMMDAYRDGNAEQGSQLLSKAVAIQFKITGLDAWTQRGRVSASTSLMNFISGKTGLEFDKLSPSFQTSLKNFDIGSAEWNLLRQTKQKQADGNNYLIPQEIDNIKAQIAEHLRSTGISDKLLNAATDRYASELKNKLTMFYHDGLAHMIMEPNAATKYYATLGGMRPGTVSGEVARYAMQFKSFSIGFMRNTLFDQFYENHDTLFGKQGYLMDTSKRGLTEKMNMGKFLVASLIAGYVSMSLKDTAKGLTPRSLIEKGKDGKYHLNKRTMAAAFMQGGGAGIYGDFAYGSLNRFGGSLASTLAGATIGGTASGVYDLEQAATNQDTYATGNGGEKIAKKAAQLAIQNAPFINVWWAKAALNYLVLNGVQEKLQPGYNKKLEENAKKQGQEYYFKPTRYGTGH